MVGKRKAGERYTEELHDSDDLSHVCSHTSTADNVASPNASWIEFGPFLAPKQVSRPGYGLPGATTCKSLHPPTDDVTWPHLSNEWLGSPLHPCYCEGSDIGNTYDADCIDHLPAVSENACAQQPRALHCSSLFAVPCRLAG